MNQPTNGPARPRLWPPRALLPDRAHETPTPTLARHELRRLVAAMVG